MRTFPLLLALLALGCGRPPDRREWVIRYATPEQEVQTYGLLAAAWAVTGDVRGHLAQGGEVTLEPTLGDLGYASTGDPIWGLAVPSEDSNWIAVIATPTDDMRRTALRHELCHVGLSTMDEAEAEACSAKVLALYEGALYP